MSNYSELIQAAARVVRSKGLHKLTRDNIAAEAGVAPSLVSHYLGTMDDIRESVMVAAVDMKDIELLRHGLQAEHPSAMGAPIELRKQAMMAFSAHLGL
jgi:AcrR family transcriptional regulator